MLNKDPMIISEKLLTRYKPKTVEGNKNTFRKNGSPLIEKLKNSKYDQIKKIRTLLIKKFLDKIKKIIIKNTEKDSLINKMHKITKNTLKLSPILLFIKVINRINRDIKKLDME